MLLNRRIEMTLVATIQELVAIIKNMPPETIVSIEIEVEEDE